MIARAPQDSFADRADDYRQRVNHCLEDALQPMGLQPGQLVAAMQYSTLGGGKRVRPLLAYAAGEVFAVDPALVDPIAVAVELVHAYSLIHDDLPAMDDDDLRRGRPTTHKAFDEATAILAGDALQALAFGVLLDHPALAARPAQQVSAIARLAAASGVNGMVGGQALDMAAENRSVTEAELEQVHRLKTGALIRAAIMMPAELAETSASERGALDQFASTIGLVFQIRDDILEVEQDTETLGKNAASDVANNKSTYPSLLGIDGARAKADALYAEALRSLRSLGENAAGLEWVAEFILRRNH